MDKPMSESDKREHLRKIINSAHTGMFITYTPTGLHGRPMANAEVSDSFTTIWFATSRSSGKVAELKRDDRVFLSYHGSGTEWATVNGRAQEVNDRHKIHELWSPLWKAWFDSADDPDLVLLEITPESAEYWDSGNKFIAYVKFAFSALTGKGAGSEDHQTLSL